MSHTKFPLCSTGEDEQFIPNHKIITRHRNLISLSAACRYISACSLVSRATPTWKWVWPARLPVAIVSAVLKHPQTSTNLKATLSHRWWTLQKLLAVIKLQEPLYSTGRDVTSRRFQYPTTGTVSLGMAVYGALLLGSKHWEGHGG